MRSRRRLGRVLLAFCISLLALPAGAETATQVTPGWGIQQLMLRLKQVKSASGQFVERKTLHVLSEPLIASGTLLYVAPDQLQKITVSPKRERLAVNGSTLVMEGGPEDRTRTLSLTDHPEVGAFVEAIRGTLAGDLPALTRFYSVQLEGNAADWRLLLQPKEKKLQDFVKWLRIAGSDNRIRSVETEEGDGDHSEMRIVEDVR
jgi:outer membrane lipoprotein-sorting protein